LTKEGHLVRIFPAAEPFLQALLDERTERPQLLMLDVRLPGESGIEVLRRMSSDFPQIPVIMMTAFGDLKVAVDAIQGRAFEYLTKPFSLEVGLHTIQRALQQIPLNRPTPDSEMIRQLRQETLLGNSHSMQEVYKQIAVAANIETPVFIEGESGTGKSLVAAMIHRFSRRCGGPFLGYRTVEESRNQCSADLFGMAMATNESPVQTGLLQLAADGTLVIEEVGGLPAATQSQILASLETGSFTAVGGSRPIDLRVRLLFTSIHGLETLEGDGDLVPALRSQLDVCVIRIPPLRERIEDIRHLIDGFLAVASDGQPMAITEPAIEQLESRSWFGNVRQLRQAIQYGAVRAKGGVIQLEDLPIELRHESSIPDTHDQMLRTATKRWISQRLVSLPNDAAIHSTTQEGFLYEECIALVEEALIEQMMQEMGGNRAAVAQRLGIHRSTLRQKMKRFGHHNWDS
ncbi:MAG: sigma-54-dependent transcriptional regulator, partial [Pirellulaceae bacterium]